MCAIKLSTTNYIELIDIAIYWPSREQQLHETTDQKEEVEKEEDQEGAGLAIRTYLREISWALGAAGKPNRLIPLLSGTQILQNRLQRRRRR